jgi:hypothetical protein
VISAGQGKIITLEVEDFDMEPEKDFVLIRDGATADDQVLATLTGSDKKHEFIVSTGSQLYIYTKTDQADSRKGYRIKYYEGKSLSVNQLQSIPVDCSQSQLIAVDPSSLQSIAINHSQFAVNPSQAQSSPVKHSQSQSITVF